MSQISDTYQRSCDISIIVPFFNERENLAQLYNEAIAVMEGLGKSFEIVFVDDGSRDGGALLVEEWSKNDARIKLVQFTRNFGQTAAMAAGFKHARGEILVAIDADNQNDPHDIPQLVAKIGEGFDCVSGWRKGRKDCLFARKIPSWLANRLISAITGCHLKDYGCTLKAYRAECMGEVKLYGEMHRFIPALAHMAGANVAEISVNHRARTRGKSKYGLKRTFKVVMDLITVKFLSSYATKPAYLFGGAGFALCIAGFASAVEVIVEKYAKGTFAHKNPFLLLAVFLFFLGVQFVLMGLIAELLVRTYHESQDKPVYLVKRRVNLAPE